MVNVKSQENRIVSNREIRAREVRLIDPDGKNLGVMPYFRALNLAQDQDLDLILISDTMPPVCKIGDAGKYKYEAQKRVKEQNKKNRESRIDIKEVQLRPQIDDHDLNIKINKIKEWIEEGDKVKIVVRFRGREMSTSNEVGARLIEYILEKVPTSNLEGKSELQGNKLTAILCQAKQNDKQKTQ